MNFFDIIRTANHNLFRSKIRTFLTILAIFVGSFTIILNVAINAGVNGFIDEQLKIVGGEDYLIITKGGLTSYAEANASGMMASANDPEEYNEKQNLDLMTSADLEKIKKIEGIRPESIVRNEGVNIDYIRSDKNGKRFVLGAAGLMPKAKINLPLSAGAMIDNDAKEDLIILPPNYAKVLGFENDQDIIGQTVILGYKDAFTKEVHEFSAKVVGVKAQGVLAMSGTPITKNLLDKMEAVNEKYLTPEQKDSISIIEGSFDLSKANEDEIKKRLEDAGYSGTTTRDIVGNIRSFFDVILVVFSIFGGIALLAAAIGIINTLYMSVEERTREIGLDKALGMSSGRVFLEFATEAILLGFWGSIFGIGVAMGLGQIVNQIVHAPGGFLEVFPTFELFRFTFDGILPIVIVVMVIAFVAGTLPAIKAARKNPIDALRYE